MTLVAKLARRFPRVAITHEWLTTPGGSEQVVAEILKLFPQAEIYTSVYDRGQWSSILSGHPVHPSFLDKLPGARESYAKLLPLMNRAFRSFDLSGYDLVISSNHACAKNVVTTGETLHVCYCHTPMRYAWDPSFLAGEQLGAGGRLAARALLPRLRRQDYRAAQGPDAFIANSSYVAARIKRHYGRDATVINPPVEVERYLDIPRATGDYYLALGRVVPYKRVHLAVAACEQLGRPIKVAGVGRGLPAVHAVAGSHTEFLGRVPHADLPGLLAGARALLFPGEEDFGIVPVEAMAAGVPVIGYGVGGVRDSVVDGESGLMFAEQTADSLADAILRFESTPFSETDVREQARGFGPERFRRELAEFVLSVKPRPRKAGALTQPGGRNL